MASLAVAAEGSIALRPVRHTSPAVILLALPSPPFPSLPPYSAQDDARSAVRVNGLIESPVEDMRQAMEIVEDVSHRAGAGAGAGGRGWGEGVQVTGVHRGRFLHLRMLQLGSAAATDSRGRPTHPPAGTHPGLNQSAPIRSDTCPPSPGGASRQRWRGAARRLPASTSSISIPSHPHPRLRPAPGRAPPPPTPPLPQGFKARSVGSTAMNEVSSRSHTIVRVTLETREGGRAGRGAGLAVCARNGTQPACDAPPQWGGASYLRSAWRGTPLL